MTENTYALIRVSTHEQNEARQVIAMSSLGIPQKNIVIEKESGRSTARTKYHKLLKRLKAGDILYIESIDRLSRDYDGIINEWQVLRQKGVIIKVIDTPMLDTNKLNKDLLEKFMSDILLRIQAFQAESEWQKIKERQAQGIAVAKANGKRLGRPKAKISKNDIKVAKQYLNREISLNTALALSKKKKSSFYSLCNAVSDMDK